MRLEIAQLRLEYEQLRIDDPAHRRALTTSLLEHGQQSPVLVCRRDGDFVLLDGYARVAALQELARDEVEALELALPEPEALVFCHRLCATRRRSALEEGWWLQELTEGFGKSQPQLAVTLGRSVSWVSRRLALVKALPAPVQEAVRQGKVSAQVATRYLVPLARANGDACQRLVAALGKEPISVRQMHQLYVGYKEGDARQREEILTHPHLYLRAMAVPAAPRAAEPETTESNRLAEDLEMVAKLCSRVRRRVRQHGLRRLRWFPRRAVLSAWREATATFDSLREWMEREAIDAGSDDPSGDPATARSGARSAGDRPDGGRVPQRGAIGGPQRPSAGPAAGP
jgi:ParB/RepB/Spo0J family partition protein